jgi:hypothetical protein
MYLRVTRRIHHRTNGLCDKICEPNIFLPRFPSIVAYGHVLLNRVHRVEMPEIIRVLGPFIGRARDRSGLIAFLTLAQAGSAAKRRKCINRRDPRR